MLSSTLAAACAPPTTTSPANHDVDLPRGVRYEVTLAAGAKTLSVDVALGPGSDQDLVVDEPAAPFVERVLVAGETTPLAPRDGAWHMPSCAKRGCSLRYVFRLADAARTLDDPGVAEQIDDDTFVAPPSTWLLRPADATAGAGYRFHVSTTAPLSFETGVFPSNTEQSVFAADLSDLPEAPYAAFGNLRATELAPAPGAAERIRVVWLPGEIDAPDDLVLDWIRTAARAVVGYYGRFPVPRVVIFLKPARGAGFGYATTLGNGGASILYPIGRRATADEFSRDWQMTHEMLHLAFPNLPREQAWLEEGIATYVEPLARARAGAITPELAWAGLARGLPMGQPAVGDRGLDRTPTWGRRYWGGALFCLVADVTIRERTEGRRSLDDALRGIVQAGGDVSVRWDVQRAIDAGDRATGVDVLHELYARMSSQPVTVDLDALLGRLGVRRTRGGVTFDDTAPLAAMRRSMTIGRSKGD